MVVVLDEVIEPAGVFHEHPGMIGDGDWNLSFASALQLDRERSVVQRRHRLPGQSVLEVVGDLEASSVGRRSVCFHHEPRDRVALGIPASPSRGQPASSEGQGRGDTPEVQFCERLVACNGPSPGVDPADLGQALQPEDFHRPRARREGQRDGATGQRLEGELQGRSAVGSLADADSAGVGRVVGKRIDVGDRTAREEA
jgi:hypothetical protein